MMEVLYTFPPLYREIDRRFNVRGKPVIFTFGSRIHNPGRIQIPNSLMVHETVHSTRQGTEPEAWWQSYLDNDEFRLIEEMEAHSAEYGHICLETDDNRLRQRELHRIASRLASPLYGSIIGYYEARRCIEDALAIL